MKPRDTPSADETMAVLLFLHERGGSVAEKGMPRRLSRIAFALSYGDLVQYRGGNSFRLTKKGAEAAARGSLEPVPAERPRRRGRPPGGGKPRSGDADWMKPQSSRSTTDVDRVVGSNIRELRSARGMSQTSLGELLHGITFQQIQKYERGDNRISATRLWQLAKVFGIDVEMLFAGLEPGETAIDEEMLTIMENAETKELATNFHRLDPMTRGCIRNLVRELGPPERKTRRARRGRRRADLALQD